MAAGQASQPVGLQAAVAVGAGLGFGAGQGVQRVGVVTQLPGGAGQRLGHPRAEHGFQHRQHLVPDPDPGEPGVGVVRVVPHRQVQRGTGGLGRGPPHRQQRPQVPAAAGGHAGQRAGAGAAGQPEQDRLGLVVQGVPEEDRDRPGLSGRRVQGLVPGRTGGGFRAGVQIVAGAGDRHRGAHHRVQAQRGQASGHRPGPVGRAGLQPVVDRDAAGPQVQPGRGEGQRGGQRERVSPARAGDQDQVARGEAGQAEPGPRCGSPPRPGAGPPCSAGSCSAGSVT